MINTSQTKYYIPSTMQKELNDIIEKSLQKAYDHDRTGNVGKAYAYYTVVAELCPRRRPEIEEAFVDVLCMLLFSIFV